MVDYLPGIALLAAVLWIAWVTEPTFSRSERMVGVLTSYTPTSWILCGERRGVQRFREEQARAVVRLADGSEHRLAGIAVLGCCASDVGKAHWVYLRTAPLTGRLTLLSVGEKLE